MRYTKKEERTGRRTNQGNYLRTMSGKALEYSKTDQQTTGHGRSRPFTKNPLR